LYDGDSLLSLTEGASYTIDSNFIREMMLEIKSKEGLNLSNTRGSAKNEAASENNSIGCPLL
jgi:hypothetical protein